MQNFFVILLFILGLVLILKGGDFLVDSAVWIAKVTKIPQMVIGATIVSITTTLPEITVSTMAIIKGIASNDPALLTEFAGMAVGNAVGSMLSNVCLSLAIVLIISKVKTEGKAFNIKAIYLTVVTISLYVFSLGDNKINLIEGITLLIAFLGFMTVNILEAIEDRGKLKPNVDELNVKNQAEAVIAEDIKAAKKENPWLMIGMFVVGAVCIFFGAKLLVDNGEKIALMLKIPMQVVGVTVIAIGTGLPEMVTSIKSAKSGNGNLGMGNILGANIINSTLLLGLISTLCKQGLPIDAITKNVGLLVLIAITLILVIPCIVKKRTFKWQGISLITIYLIYLTYNVIAVL